MFVFVNRIRKLSPCITAGFSFREQGRGTFVLTAPGSRLIDTFTVHDIVFVYI